MVELEIINRQTQEFRNTMILLDQDRPECLLGRGDEADLILDSSNVSRQHAKLISVNGAYELIDLDSKNGTFINTQKINSSCKINPLDQIEIGHFLIFVQSIQNSDLFAKSSLEPMPKHKAFFHPYLKH